MNEEIEYAEMLEIPVSTVNVVHKKSTRKRKTQPLKALFAQKDEGAETSPPPPERELKETVIAQVNDKMFDPLLAENDTTDAQTDLDAAVLENENGNGSIDFGDIPERIDTVRLYSEQERANFKDGELYTEEFALQTEPLPALTKKEKRIRMILSAEFAAACALCGAIFLTNVFMPNSAINTFFRALDGTPNDAQADMRTYNDFQLSRIVSDFSSAELTVSPTGIVSFTDECCVYPAADGKVNAVSRQTDGTYTLKVAYSDTFTGVFDGLDQVYYQVGDVVKANVPIGYSEGETQVQVTMYSGGVLLNCLS